MTDRYANLAGSSRASSAGIGTARSIPVVALGLSLSAFFVISYVSCILGYLLFPNLPVEHDALTIFLPGFTLLSWQSYFLGLVESFGADYERYMRDVPGFVPRFSDLTGGPRHGRVG